MRATLPPLLIAFALTLPAAAQTVVSDRVSCRDCVIQATARIILGTEAAPAGLAGVPTQAARDGRGNYWVLVPGQLPLVFNARGAFTGEIGRRGGGPGEFQGVTSVAALPADSVLLVDARLSRATVLGPDFGFVRSMSLPVPGGRIAVVKWPELVAVNSVGSTPAQVGWPLHFLDFSKPAAVYVNSFGDARAARGAANTPAQLRHFFNVGATSFWAAHVLRYQLTQYSAAGRALRTIRRQAGFFPGESSWSLGSPAEPPPAFLETAVVKGDTLWVALRVARPDWKKAWAGVTLPGSGEIPASRGPESTQLHMTRIEAIDLRKGVLIAHRSFNGIVVHLGPDLTALLYDLDERQVPRLRLVDIRLTRS